MPTYGAIREQVRQAMDEGRVKRCSEERLNLTCMLIHALATGQTDRLFDALSSDAEREGLREGLALIQAENAEEIRLVRAETDRLFAAAYQQGLTADAAEELVQATVWREFYWQNYREIREAVRWKLATVEDPPIPVSEETLQSICVGLAHLSLDRSGLTLRRHSTNPQLWNDDGEAVLTYLRQRFAREIALLDAETARLADTAEAQGMRDGAVRRMIQGRLNREFIGRRRRRRPSCGSRTDLKWPPCCL
jgi:hypothetical protein